MYPFDDAFIVNQLFGFLTVRWYAVAILGGAMLAAWFGARRVTLRGYDADHVWNLLAFGLITSIAFARAWYVFFEWPSFRDKSVLYIINPATGGIAIQGAIVGALCGAFLYTRWYKLSFLEWIDLGAPCLSIGQAIGRWGNFMNQEAYGRPMATPLPWGLRIDADRRVPAFPAETYPVATTRFHPTFLYESLWNVLVLIALLAMERRFRRRLFPGDEFLVYGILYSVGRFFIEGLRTDSLCSNGIGGACAGALRAAQVTAIVTIVLFGALLALRHLRRRPAQAEPARPLVNE
ncbi:MAG: prolipoprotein diacylglyceryl transferase [Chloroflexota bacterium]|nr:prolipoprotein diacylglyceryl transferase [Chloroflexota bacterium]